VPVAVAMAIASSSAQQPAPRPQPGGVTGQYPGRHVRLENRRIFRVSSETHFPLSVFVGETGFGLLSARRDQRRRRHGRKDPISKNLEKSSTFCEKSFMHRHFPATSWLPTAPSCTPNSPPCTPGAPWVDSDRRRWDSAFFGFPPFPPTRTPLEPLFTRKNPIFLLFAQKIDVHFFSNLEFLTQIFYIFLQVDT